MILGYEMASAMVGGLIAGSVVRLVDLPAVVAVAGSIMSVGAAATTVESSLGQKFVDGTGSLERGKSHTQTARDKPFTANLL